VLKLIGVLVVNPGLAEVQDEFLLKRTSAPIGIPKREVLIVRPNVFAEMASPHVVCDAVKLFHSAALPKSKRSHSSRSALLNKNAKNEPGTVFHRNRASSAWTFQGLIKPAASLGSFTLRFKLIIGLEPQVLPEGCHALVIWIEQTIAPTRQTWIASVVLPIFTMIDQIYPGYVLPRIFLCIQWERQLPWDRFLSRSQLTAF
jgi:hypothetical protein